MMAGYTKGPWVWLDRASDHWVHEEDEGLIMSGTVEVCNFGNNKHYYNTAGTAPNQADIALICAAPDMLAALQSVLAEFPAFDGKRIESVKAICRSAIAKAVA